MKAGPILLAMALLALDRAPMVVYPDDPTHGIITERSLALTAATPGYGELTSFKDILKKASVAEDATPRFNHHFYDPSTGRGLPQNLYTVAYEVILMAKEGTRPDFRRRGSSYTSALEWGRNGMPDDLDWEGAISAYDYTGRSRERAYEALGHVLHLLQDMAQPDHARNRPHPGNYVRGFLENLGVADRVPADIVPPDRVGFEQLWKDTTNVWPAGSAVQKRPSLEEAFNDLAREGQKAEEELGLPLPDEVALGLGPPRNRLAEVNPLITVAATFRKNLWAKYELNAPVVPTIPWPGGDFRTHAYLLLGRRLLPKAEEYGAGLLMLFHDIVNPPPFVESVEVRQGETVKYRKSWVDRRADDRVTGRQEVMAVGDGTLEAGVAAQVRIRFGPSVSLGGEEVREAVNVLRVALEPAGSPGGAGRPCPTASELQVGGSPSGEPGTWAGTFTPLESGTLCIEAVDVHEHFAGRASRGDSLDSSPATPAKAGATPPYEWSGYEPSADRNHSFTVEAEECAAGPVTPEKMKPLRWGTWSGTVKQLSEGKDFDRLLPGHDKPHARVWTTSTTETSVDVTFRALASPFIGSQSTDPVADFGRSEGSYGVKTVVDRRYGEGSTEHEESGSAGDVKVGGSLRLEPDLEGQFRYDVDLEGRRQGETGWESIVALRVSGNVVCGDGAMTGSAVHEVGDRNTDSWGRTVVSWSFSFTPSEPPPHVVLGEKLLFPEELASGVGNVYQQVYEMLTPAQMALSNAGRYTEAAELGEAITAAHSDFYDRESVTLYDLFPRLPEMHGELSRLWLSDEPGAEGEYSGKLASFRSLVDDWNARKGALAEKLAQAVEQEAAKAEPTDPGTARQLRAIAQKLRIEGLDTFAERY